MIMTTILVVDDNLLLRSVMVRRLSRTGLDVLVASNGEEGVETARAALPDLILMDMTMPVMDGWTAAKLLRDDPLTRHIPIVACTAQPLTSRDGQNLPTGCDARIAKPYKFSEVLAAIERFLDRPDDTAFPRS